MLFNGTIFQNVSYGLSGTPEAELSDDEKHALVEQACKAAYAHEFIEKFPKVKMPSVLHKALPKLYLHG